MALSYVATSIVAYGGNTITPALPSGWQEGDLAVLVVATAEDLNAIPTVTAPGGEWAYAGTVASTDPAAINFEVGPRRLTFFTRQFATGDGAPTVTLPASFWATITVRMILLRKAATESWRVSTPVFGEDSSSDVAFSATMGGVPARMTTDAFLVAGYASPVTTGQSMSARTITAAGATIGAVTERADNAANTAGAKVTLGIASASVTAGTATAAPVVGGTFAVASAGVAGLVVVSAVTGSLTASQATRGDMLRINGLTNPGAESGSTSGWTVQQTLGAGTVDVVDVVEEGLGVAPSDPTSRRAFRVTGAATNTTTLGLQQTLVTALPAGTTVTVSADVYIPAGSPADSMRFAMVNPAGTTVSTGIVASVSTGWGRYSYTWTITGSTGLGRVYAYTNDAQNLRGADIVYFDNLMLDVHPALREYMDGNSNVDGYVHQWLGAAQFSESGQWRAADPPRVGVTLFNWAVDADVQVYRVHADGTRHEVRSGLLTPSGGAAFVWDYEFPTNEEFYYVANDAGTERTTSSLDEVLLRRNVALNPTLTADATGWATVVAAAGTASGARVDGVTDGPLVGGVRRDYYRMTWNTITGGAVANTGITYGSSASTMVAASPGPWVASIYSRSNVIDRTTQMSVQFYDGAGAAVGSALLGAVDTGIAARWTRSSVSATAPAGAVRALVRLYAAGGAVWAVNSTMDATALLVEDNQSSVLGYFDGDTPSAGVRWTGTAGASVSEEFATNVLTPLVVNDARSFLRSPGLPGLDIPVRIGRVPATSRPRPTNFLAPLGRATLVPQAGARQKPSYGLELVTFTDADAQSLIEFMEGTPTALLMFPGTRLHNTYVALADLTEAPVPTVGPQEVRWSVAATQVARPAGGVAYDPLASWAGLVTTSGSWQSVLNTYPTWLDVLRGPPEA